MLTAKRLREVLNYDEKTGLFTWRMPTSKNSPITVGQVAGCDDGDGYLMIRIDYRIYRAHRLAWMHVYGDWPNGLIDHVNGTRSDNRISNLREATPTQNSQNRGTPVVNTSGFKGVRWDKNGKQWRADIRHHGRKIYLGLHDTPEAAHEAYVKASHEFHGQFARTK